MPTGALVDLAVEGLLLAVRVSLPVVGAAALASLVVAVLQAATQLTDSTLSHLPRLVAVAAALVVAGPWMGREIIAFAARAFAFGS